MAGGGNAGRCLRDRIRRWALFAAARKRLVAVPEHGDRRQHASTHGGPDAGARCRRAALEHAHALQEQVDARRARRAIERQRGAQGSPLRAIEAGRTLGPQVFVTCLRRRQPIVRMVPGQQFIGDAGKRVDVVARIRFAMLEHLRARIGRRDAAKARRVEHGYIGILVAPLEGARDPEVDHLHFATVGEEHIGGLEIAVHEAALMRIRQRVAHAGDDRQCGIERHAREAWRTQHLAERLARQILHREVDERAVAIEVVDGDDVSMGERLRLAGFALKRDQRRRLAAKLHVEHLDRDVRLAIRGLQLAEVERLVHGAHPADTETLLQHEAPVQRIADAFHALAVDEHRAARRAGPGARTRLRVKRGFLDPGGVAGRCGLVATAFDAFQHFRIDVVRQRLRGLRLVEHFAQLRAIDLLGRQHPVDLREERVLRQRPALECLNQLRKAHHSYAVYSASACRPASAPRGAATPSSDEFDCAPHRPRAF